MERFTLKEEVKDVYPVEKIEEKYRHTKTYIGSTYLKSKKGEPYIHDYYITSDGKYWYETLGYKDGVITTMEEIIFGRKLKKRRKAYHDIKAYSGK